MSGYAQAEFGTTPEEYLERAGIQVSPLALQGVLLDSSRSIDDRRHCAMALGKMKGEIPLAALSAALLDYQPEIRGAALVGLRELRRADAVTSIEPVLHGDVDKHVRRLAVGALQSIGGFAAANALLVAADDNTQHVEVRLAALGGLREVRRADDSSNTTMLGGLQRLSMDENLDIRAYSAVLLADDGGVESLPQLVEAVLNPETADYIRNRCKERLQSVTGVDFGFFSDSGSPVDFPIESVAMHRLYKWWDQHSREYASYSTRRSRD